MSDNKNNGRGILGKGYYIALAICAAAIGISALLFYQNSNEEPTLQDTAVNASVGAAVTDEDLAVAATTATDATKSTVPVQTVKPEPDTSMKTVSPVSGNTVTEYAMDCLSYNQTTRDWRVHNGVDIAAEAGSTVCAAADGTVYTIYEDDALGHTVVIRHNGGYVTQYSSLSEDVAVSVGDSVKAGQAIGSVGSSALLETAVGDHVHFCVTYQDNPMDPAEFLTLGE